MDDPQATFIALRGRMLGREIVNKRLFLSTLQLYLAPERGAELGLEVWCEPSWQLAGREGVIAESDAIEFDPEAEDPDALQRLVSEATDVLRGCLVEDVAIDARTFELGPGRPAAGNRRRTQRPPSISLNGSRGSTRTSRSTAMPRRPRCV
jgi:hypothetical protein